MTKQEIQAEIEQLEEWFRYTDNQINKLYEEGRDDVVASIYAKSIEANARIKQLKEML